MNLLTYEFIKKNLIIIVILLVIYLLYNMVSIYSLQRNKVELFENYERNIITISKEALNPLNVSVGYKGGNYDLLVRNISNTYPLIVSNHNGSSIENVNKLLNGECDMCICQLDAAIAARTGTIPFSINNDDINNNKDLRFVCNLYPEVTTLVVNQTSGITRWQDLKGKTIALSNDSYSSYYNFITLLEIAGIDIDEVFLVTDGIFTNFVMSQFKNDNIDAIYLTTPHPRIDLYNLYLMKPFNIIGTEDLVDLKKTSIPSLKYFNEYKLDLQDYNIKQLNNQKIITCLSVPCCLITKSSVDKEYIYKLIKTILSDIEFIQELQDTNEVVFEEQKKGENTYQTRSDFNKTETKFDKNKNSFYNQIMKQIKPSLLMSFPEDLEIHEGIRDYYTEIGILTTIDNMNCANYAGSKKCHQEKDNKPHFGHGSIG